MKILVYRWDIYPYENIIDTLKKQGHLVDVLAFPISNHISDEAFSPVLKEKLADDDYDMVFSVNYYAVIGKICFENTVPYVSWTCDTPLLSMLHPSVYYPTNYIFTFDLAEYKKFKQQGLSQIYYLPLAGIPQNVPPDNSLDTPGYQYDISFVGSLYEKNRYEEMNAILPDKLCGYMDAIIEAGKRISGGNFISQMLTPDILSQVSQYVSLAGEGLSEEALRIHFETAVLSYKIAADVRSDALWLLAQNHRVDLFTPSSCKDTNGLDLTSLNTLRIHPPADYHRQMPGIFRHSKINLNFTIPNITNGIPLRVFDVLSCGGFLLTDYRDALCELLEDGKELVIFHGMTDLLQKTDYYLNHPQEREAIARNGMEKVHRLHQYKDRIKEIFDILNHQTGMEEK